MPRNLTSGQLAAISAPTINLALFVLLTFKTQTVYLWSGIGSVTWNGHTWLGVGNVLNISSPEDSTTVEAKGITLTLSGLDATLLPEAMTDFSLGLPVTLYLALYDGSNTLIDSPFVAWAGRMDQPTIDVSGTAAVISLNCENRLLDMNVAVDRRLTNEDQQMTFPGDLGLMFVTGIQQVTLFWGQYPMASNNI